MPTGIIIGMGIVLGIPIVIMIGLLFQLKLIGIELYFLRHEIENHPILQKMVDDVIAELIVEEKVPIFYKTMKEINGDVVALDEAAVGMYIYAKNEELQEKANVVLAKIENLEKKYNQPYHIMCLEAGEKVIYKDDFILPRILICRERLIEIGGFDSMYGTIFHEFGHHFARKSLETHDENDANYYGHQLILNKLPYYFQALPTFRYAYRLNESKLTSKEKRKIYWAYYTQYYLPNRKEIRKFKLNKKDNEKVHAQN